MEDGVEQLLLLVKAFVGVVISGASGALVHIAATAVESVVGLGDAL